MNHPYQGCLYKTTPPSLWEEALGFVALEGAASGLPIVAFRSGGLPEIVLDGVTGRIAEKGDWDALSALCCELLKQPDLAALVRFQRKKITPHGPPPRHCVST
jgi:glycosyltransferase involved in cell wall biosynthesis